METMINIFVGLLCVLLLLVIVFFVWIWYQAYKLRKQTEEFVVKKVVDIDLNKGISKFQERLNREVENKKNKI